MSDLAAWLLDRIAEDEALARTAAPGPWDYGGIASVAGGGLYDPTVLIASISWDAPGNEPDPRIRRTVPSAEADCTGVHLARWDPARVLAECEAKRRIVEEWQSRNTTGGWYALACLALPYADHEGYDESWRP